MTVKCLGEVCLKIMVLPAYINVVVILKLYSVLCECSPEYGLCLVRQRDALR